MESEQVLYLDILAYRVTEVKYGETIGVGVLRDERATSYD